MDAFESDDEEIPSFAKKNGEKGKGKDKSDKPAVKTNYLPEHELWVVLTDTEMDALVADPESKEAPSEYKIGLFVAEKLNALEEGGSITSVKAARSVMDSPERTCIKYMRAMIEPAIIKKLIASEFPAKDFKSILERVKNLCPVEMDQYNKRLALRKQILSSANIAISPPQSPEKAPLRTSSSSQDKTPTKSAAPPRKEKDTPDKGERTPSKSTPDKDKRTPRGKGTPRKDEGSGEEEQDVHVVFPKTIDKFDMTKVKLSDELVGQQVSFIKVKWQSYVGYQIHADGDFKLFLNKYSMQYLKNHGHSDLPKLIQGKITEIKEEKATGISRYDLKEGDTFGIATLEFATKKKI